MKAHAGSQREDFVHARKSLVDRLKGKGIRDEAVLDALRKVPRDRFMEEAFVNLAYKDQALPIGYGQTISQPYVVAYMTQTLVNGKPLDKVLEIGTGCGYQAAVLANLVARVFTIERIAPLQREAKRRLKELGYDNVHFRCGDGRRGWQKFAPYDAVIVTAAAREAPPVLLEQLAPGGRMVIPIGADGEDQNLRLITRAGARLVEQPLGAVRFVPLVKERA